MLNSKLVLADGMIIRPDPYGNRWDYTLETNQQAFISYKNGLEKLILSVGIEEANMNAVWIFPIPTEPEKTVIDILPKLPRLIGEDIAKKAKSKLPEIKKLLQLSQLYSYFFLRVPEKEVGYRGIEGFGMLGAVPAAGVIETDVVVHEHLEKEGLTTEVVTAKTAQGLFDYLKNKNLKIEKGAIPALDYYIGKEFTFVVSWITSPTPLSRDEIEQKLHYFLVEHPHDPSVVSVKFNYEITANFETLRQHLIRSREEGFRYLEQNPEEKERLVDFLVRNEYLLHPTSKGQKGVFVTFPTNKIYYPLIPTSVYGSEKVPAEIRIIGFVSPQIFRDIKGYTKVSYFTNQDLILDPELEDFYEGAPERYTKIAINAPSKLLTEDLWISKRTPLKAIYTSFIANNPVEPIAFTLLMISSVITGIIIGLLVFREARSKKGLLKYAFIGLSNSVTILGLIVVLAIARTKEIRDEDKEALSTSKNKEFLIWAIQARDARKLLYLPLFSFSFLVISWLMIEVISFSLGNYHPFGVFSILLNALFFPVLK